MAGHWLQIDKENGRVLRETFAPLYEVVHQQWLRLITFNALPHSKGTGNWKVKNSLFSFWSVTYKYGGIDAKRLRSNNRNTWHQELWLWLDNYSTSAHLEISGLHAGRCFIKPYESEIRIRAFETFIKKKALRCIDRPEGHNRPLSVSYSHKTSYAHYHLKSGCFSKAHSTQHY